MLWVHPAYIGQQPLIPSASFPSFLVLLLERYSYIRDVLQGLLLCVVPMPRVLASAAVPVNSPGWLRLVLQ
jgi:hypothetical protein